MRWEADVKIAGPVGSMGQRVLQPIVNQQVGNGAGALDGRSSRRLRRGGRDDDDAAGSAADVKADGARSRDATPLRSRSGRRPRDAEAADGPPAATRATSQPRRGMARSPGQGDPSPTPRLGTEPCPFRIGVMQLTMEPLEEMLESARVMDEAGMDTIWLAEAYPWWRKHGMEARSSTVVSALMARETERLTIGWGIISPFTRHPVQVAMDARVVQEAAGPGRFLLGFGTSKIFLNNIRMQTKKTLGPMRDAVAIVRGVLGGEAFEYEGETWSASVPALRGRRPHAARGAAGLRRRDRAEDAGARRRDRRRLPDAVDHDARLRPLHARERRRGHRHRLHGRRLDRRGPRRRPRRRARDRRHVPREQGAEHPRRGRHAARARRDRPGRDPAGRRGDGARRPARGEGRGDGLDPRPLQADRRHARRLHRRDRGVPRRRLHARHARALGRRPARPDPPLRRAGAAAHFR